ncbi:MAG: phage distal tail protein, Rcc01695 family [Henriciella sp.]
MTSQHQVAEFPLALAFGARGGPQWKTDIIELASGAEIRNSVWKGSRRRWQVNTASAGLERIRLLVEFFEACNGPRRSFRFRDPFDHSSAVPGYELTPYDQVLMPGDGIAARFQLVKAYGSYQRDITKPVAKSVRVGMNGEELLTGWQVEAETGQLMFSAPPPAGAQLTAGFQFDCMVRFEQDQIEVQTIAKNAGRVMSIGLIEVPAETINEAA